MPRTLVLFAHPALEKSRMHRRLVRDLPALAARTPGLTFHDLYEAYPDFDVDVAREQALLVAHDLIVVQHPFYWYSTPALLKQWEDLVLEHGWAYGSRGLALAGKRVLHVITLGGGAQAYRRGGYNRFTLRELLAPLDQTARLCRMTFLPPYAVFGTHGLDDSSVEREGVRYTRLIAALAADQVTWPDDDCDAARDGASSTGERVVDGDAVDALLAAVPDPAAVTVGIGS
jgi:glutathione-regulated potassium-efflux system ancillary protein KefG